MLDQIKPVMIKGTSSASGQTNLLTLEQIGLGQAGLYFKIGRQVKCLSGLELKRQACFGCLNITNIVAADGHFVPRTITRKESHDE